ncbi:tyrosine-type recombinase/integrase [Aminipila luticellarii]|uniref:Site-specific integrase n=1 Tax=Aminipila luticellarii TaxID=2507160 RepID=A0A410PX12_9FIRM|nr:site-specific integrase [Aminipila luticellarii]QAT43479.1 site-specific integrase [Aminipila luticellarii]
MPGTYRKRGKDSYLLEVCIGADYTGKPIRYNKTVHCKSPREADKALAKFYTDCEAGNYAKESTLTISQLCDLYMKEHAKHSVKASTYSKYAVLIKNQIKPYIGKKKANKITVLQLQQWINDLYESGLSNKSVHCAFSLLRTIFTTVKKWQLISANPCEDVTLKPLRPAEADFYNRDEVFILIDKIMALSNDELTYKVAVMLDLFTGLRASEICGLKWEDIYWGEKSLTVERNRSYVHGFGVVEDSPKTKKSQRTISVPVLCINLLKEYQLYQKKEKIRLGSKWNNSGYVFVNEFGEPIFPRNINRWFPNFIKREGLRKITFHQLRHTHTSILDYLGVSEIQISKRLGHSQLSTTRNTYTHIFNNSDQEAAQKMDDYFSKLINQK